jgi:hypothetical protein
MRKLFYMGLEPYEGRYTLQLEEWSRRAFARRDISWVNVPGKTIDNTKAISVGQVLDAHGRSYFAMSQAKTLYSLKICFNLEWNHFRILWIRFQQSNVLKFGFVV